MKTYPILLLSGLLLLSTFGCGGAKDANPSSPKRQAAFDFFNDVRREVGALEAQNARLSGFGDETKTFLENRGAQQGYAIGALYFEKGLKRNQGAISYADRFADNGMVVLVELLTPTEEEIYQARLEKNERGKGKQVGNNYVFYQVFTAKPRDAGLEEKVNEIIEANIEAHAATLAQPIQ